MTRASGAATSTATQEGREHRRAELPYEPDMLTGRSLNSRKEIESYRARRHLYLIGLQTPAYVNTDAAQRRGVASLAYTSAALGTRVAVIRCDDSTRAEYLALLMAMYDADKACLPGPIEFRVDSTALHNYRNARKVTFIRLGDVLDQLLEAHPTWRLTLVRGKENLAANNLARKALDKWDHEK